jgi:hypothetical protein
LQHQKIELRREFGVEDIEKIGNAEEREIGEKQCTGAKVLIVFEKLREFVCHNQWNRDWLDGVIGGRSSAKNAKASARDMAIEQRRAAKVGREALAARQHDHLLVQAIEKDACGRGRGEGPAHGLLAQPNVRHGVDREERDARVFAPGRNGSHCTTTRESHMPDVN